MVFMANGKLFESGHSGCAGCGVALALRTVIQSAGPDTVVSLGTSCSEIISTRYPETSWRVPVIHSAFENAAATASGIAAALKKLGKDGKVRVLSIAGDGGTFDIGLQALSGALERGHKVTYVCVDNECYANTGVQRSGATPYGAWTTTSPEGAKSIGNGIWKKPIAEIVAAHRIPYVASASIAYLPDLEKKIKKALQNQPSFVHVYCTCPVGWKADSRQTIKIARLAVETGIWSLFEIEDGVFRRTMKPKGTPVAEYLKLQGRFRHLAGQDVAHIQDVVNKNLEELDAFEKCGGRFRY